MVPAITGTITKISPFILSFFTENVIGKGGIARAEWPPSNFPISFYFHGLCLSAQRRLEHCVKGWSHRLPRHSKASPSLLFSSGFLILWTSEVSVISITIHLSSCPCKISETTGFLPFVSLFFHIYCISISVCCYQALHYDTRERSLSLEITLNLNDNSQI